MARSKTVLIHTDPAKDRAIAAGAKKLGISKSEWYRRFGETTPQEIESNQQKSRSRKRFIESTQHIPRAKRYAKRVVSGEIPASKYVIASVRRSLDLFGDAKWGYYPARVNEVIRFIENLRHVKGIDASLCIKLQDWQVFIISEIYGWRERANPSRRKYREILIEVGRKNGKTTLMAALSLYELIHGDSGAEVYSVATKTKQAKIVWTIAAQMIDHDEDIRLQAKVLNARGQECGIYVGHNSFEPLSKESKKQDGLNPSCATVDEAGAIVVETAISVITTATGSRLNILLAYITTAYENKITPYYAKREYLIEVLTGQIDDPYMTGFIYCLDEKEEYKDESKWVKANPNLDVSLIREVLASSLKQAEVATHQLNDLLLKHFNVWVEGSSAYIDADTWRRCKREFSKDDLKDLSCFIGLDLALTTDLAAIGCLWQSKGFFYLTSKCWTTEAYLEGLTSKVKPIYRRAIDQGLLVVCPGRVIDYDLIENELVHIYENNFVVFIGTDPHNAKSFRQQLSNQGYDIKPVSQSITRLNSATKLFQQLAYKKRLYHDGSEFWSWQIANCVTYRDVNDNLKVKKPEVHPYRKIDSVIAWLCCTFGLEMLPDLEFEDRLFTRKIKAR